MNTGDWIFYYATQTVEWLNPLVSLVGLIIAVWAFRRCRKWGYLVVAIYFALSAFMLLAMPSINRAIRAHRSPDYSAETQGKIAAAINEAVQKVLTEEGCPYGIPMQRTIHFPFGPMLLVAGLWLLAKREPDKRAEQAAQVATTPTDE